MKTVAYVDGQNLYYGITKCFKCSNRFTIPIQDIKLKDCVCGFAWKINFSKFRSYLYDKYEVEEAYYFLGYLSEENQDLYTELQLAGFIIIFKEHNPKSISKKKGNIYVDLVFEIMKRYKGEDFKLVLVSGDGDYRKMVDYFIERKLLKKIIFPNISNASNLYKELGSEYYDHLTNLDIRSSLR